MQTVTPVPATRTWWSEDSSGNYTIVDAVYPLESYYNNPDLTTTLICNQASATDSGYISTEAQTIAGVKTFNAVPICASTATQDNELVNKGLLDTTVRIQMSFKPPVDNFQLMPPALPVIGGRWIATNVGDPDFVKDYIYEYTDDGYVETPVLDGFCVVNNGDNRSYVYDTSAPAGWRYFTVSLYGNAQLQSLTADAATGGTEAGAGAIKCTNAAGGFYCNSSSVLGDTEVYSDVIPQFTVKNKTNIHQATMSVYSNGSTDVRSYDNSLVLAGSTHNVHIDGDDHLLVINPDSSTSSSTGALRVTGGAFIGGQSLINNKLVIQSATEPQLVIKDPNDTGLTIYSDASGKAQIAANGTELTLSSDGVNGVVRTAAICTMKVLNTTVSTSTSTGALTVVGGVGIAKQLHIGDTTNASSTSTGSLVVAGGMGIVGTIYSSGEIRTSDSLRTGGIRLLASSPNSIIQSSLTQVTNSFSPINICLYNSAVPIHRITDLAMNIYPTTAATSTQTGALTVSGGVGIGGDLWVGGTIHGAMEPMQQDLQIISNAKPGSGVTWTNLGAYPQIFGYEFPDTSPDKQLTFSAQLPHGVTIDNVSMTVHFHVCWNVGVYNAALNTRWSLDLFAFDTAGVLHSSTLQTVDIPSSTWSTAAKAYMYNLYTIPAATWTLGDSSIITGILTRVTSATQDTDARTFLVIGFDIHYNTQF